MDRPHSDLRRVSRVYYDSPVQVAIIRVITSATRISAIRKRYIFLDTSRCQRSDKDIQRERRFSGKFAAIADRWKLTRSPGSFLRAPFHDVSSALQPAGYGLCKTTAGRSVSQPAGWPFALVPVARKSWTASQG